MPNLHASFLRLLLTLACVVVPQTLAAQSEPKSSEPKSSEPRSSGPSESIDVASHVDSLPTRIGLGSCIRQDRDQPIWEAVLLDKPDLFILLGDNIYGDSEDPEILQAKYEALASNPGFARLRKQCPLIAIWDDHDYGVNDGGLEYPTKQKSQELFNDFFNVAPDSPRRSRPGIYDDMIFSDGDQTLQIILLDTRYFRSPLRRVRSAGNGIGPYGPDESPSATMLGEAQWTWLESALQKPADLRIIASSIQFASDQHGWECWGTFPKEQQRMVDLIEKTKARGVVFLSGDRHKAEISKLPANDTSLPYDLYDLTSSSLNQPSGSAHRYEENPFRVGNQFHQVNFGTIDIDWKSGKLTLGLKDVTGRTVEATTIDFPGQDRG